MRANATTAVGLLGGGRAAVAKQQFTSPDASQTVPPRAVFLCCNPVSLPWE